MKNDLMPHLSRVAFIGNYLPRQCGIATFTTDVCESFAAQYPETQAIAIAINDTDEGYDYPAQVRYEIWQDDLFSYERAASFINQHVNDVICLQHEYGIYGGTAGSHILTLLRNVNAPVVTTLHTVLDTPDPDQRRVLLELAQLSDRLVVMSQRSKDFLKEIYGVPEDKIDHIPHGIPDVSFVDPGFYKDRFGAEGKYVLLTFGLLSPNKGVENVIEALPKVVEKYPNLVYVVLGATHPHVVLLEGESYREHLQNRVRELGLEDHVLFHNQFVALEELTEFIGAADIYITPYLNPAQAVSGTLAYTVGAGKAVISTPYWHAEELLDEGRGVLVPFRDANAIAEQILYLLENEAERQAMRKRAYLYGRDMVWPMVAEMYRQSFERARREHLEKAFPICVTGFAPEQNDAVPAINLDHIERLTDGTGMLQHAVYSVPNYSEGYTTDDNARALIVSVKLEELSRLSDDRINHKQSGRVQEMAYRYLAFLWHAFNPETRRFRNFMGFDRRWLEETGSEDSHGRALWALGVVLSRSRREGLQGMAVRLYEAAIHTTLEFNSPRAWAYTIFSTQRYLKRYPGDRAVASVQDTLAQRLIDLYRQNCSDAWPWFEDGITYCNPILPQALLLYGPAAGNEEATQIGLESLKWLVEIQQSPADCFMPVGCNGFYWKGGEKANFDQQPVEAYSMVSACLEAYRATGENTWYRQAKQAFDWFLGRNVVGLPLYDKVTGGCKDGLHVDRVNENQGAESTVSFVQALVEMQLIEMEYRGIERANGLHDSGHTFGLTATSN